MIDQKDITSLETALNRLIMWGPATGAYGNISHLEFGSNHKVTYNELELLDQEPWNQWQETEATFLSSRKGLWRLLHRHHFLILPPPRISW